MTSRIISWWPLQKGPHLAVRSLSRAMEVGKLWIKLYKSVEIYVKDQNFMVSL